ncbi:MAG: hypothetical protein ACI39N_04435 [Lachnospiraceae bacterium]
MIENVINAIQEVEKVLVGIGEAFEEKFEGLKGDAFRLYEQEEPLLAGYEKIEYLRKQKNHETEEAYRKLYELLKDKDYFIITTCMDDRIYSTPFDNSKIVAPCGTYRFLQCSDNCSKEILPVTEKMITERERIVCPHCKKEACFNQVTCEHYNENGYLPQWEVYRKWLQQTVNRKLCILELGVGMKYPTVIRWPFEKIVMYNQKAKMFRVHETLYQLTKEIDDKAVSVAENPITFLCN